MLKSSSSKKDYVDEADYNYNQSHKKLESLTQSRKKSQGCDFKALAQKNIISSMIGKGKVVANYFPEIQHSKGRLSLQEDEKQS